MVGGRDYRELAVQPRHAGPAPAGLGVQAVRPGDRAARRASGRARRGCRRSSRSATRRVGCDFEVNNYEDAYAGVTTLASATTFSDNAVYAQVGLKVGPAQDRRDSRERMGIRTPVSRNCAMTLGGLKEGVTPLDMAHAYQTFATGGQFVTGSLGPDRGPVGIREICRRDGDELQRQGPRTRSSVERVLPQGVAEQTNQILSTVIASGTAVRARIDEFAAGKTGTTENYGDAWFVGFTKQMTVAVWVGYPNKLIPMETEYRGEPVAGGTYPAEIWRDFMVAADKISDARENEQRAKEGKPPEEEDEGEEPPPGVADDARAPTAPAQAEEPTPEPAATTRPETRAPETAAATAAAARDARRPSPSRRPTPAPTPAPAPAPAPERHRRRDPGRRAAAAPAAAVAPGVRRGVRRPGVRAATRARLPRAVKRQSRSTALRDADARRAAHDVELGSPRLDRRSGRRRAATSR